jgi:hypothetical protein
MSGAENPFAPPQLIYTDLPPQDSKKLKQYAQKLAVLRANPPTFLGILFSWRMALSVSLGLGITLAVAWVYRGLPRPYNAFPLVGVGSLFLGVFLRDIGNIRRFAKNWKLQVHFIDWRKVDDFASQSTV